MNIETVISARLKVVGLWRGGGREVGGCKVASLKIRAPIWLVCLFAVQNSLLVLKALLELVCQYSMLTANKEMAVVCCQCIYHKANFQERIL